MPDPITDTYICAECRGAFAFEWSDEEAHAEAVQNFGRDGHSALMAIVCDVCYRKIMGLPESDDAVDPHAADSEKPTTRDTSSDLSAPSGARK